MVHNLQNKVNKTMQIFCELQNTLRIASLITIFNQLIRPHLDYQNINYDRIYNTLFHQNIKSTQYNAALAITNAVPLDWNSPCHSEGASHQEVSTQVRQREELNWASQLKSSDQQIFSTMSSPDSTLIRQRLERPSLVKAPLSV